MSLLGLIDQTKVDAGMGGIEAPSTGIGDVGAATFDAVTKNYNFTSKTFFEDSERFNRDKHYKELSGRDLYADAFAADPNADQLFAKYRIGEGFVPDEAQTKAVDSYINQLRTQDPEKYKGLMNSGQLQEFVKGQAQDAAQAQTKARAGATTTDSAIGMVAGGLAAGFVDPVNLVSTALGAGVAAGIIKTALVEASINAASEVAIYPFVKKWQDELGQEYGAGDLAMNMGFAALFGGVVGGGVKALKVGLDKLDMPNSTKLSEMRERFDELDNVEAVEALRHEERRLHIQESDPSRYNPEVDPAFHPKALAEVDAAINEGRPVRVDIPDEQIRNMDKVAGTDAGALKNIKLKGVEPSEIRQEVSNNILSEPRAEPIPLERRQEILDMYDSPEMRKAERAEFEQRFKDPEERIWMDADDTGEVKDFSAGELRTMFREDEEFFSAISSCGLPKGDA